MSQNSQQTHMILVITDVRSTHNVGTMLRTADAAGVKLVYCVGITPTPARPNDSRPGHVISAATKAIAKTALGAQQTVAWQYHDTLPPLLDELKAGGYQLYALECNRRGATDLFTTPLAGPAVLIVGAETTGLDQSICDRCDAVLEIPMHGHKGSLNVAVATGIGLYQLRARVQA